MLCVCQYIRREAQLYDRVRMACRYIGTETSSVVLYKVHDEKRKGFPRISRTVRYISLQTSLST